MTLTIGIIILGVVFALSVGVNIILFWYMRKTLSRFYVASEEASEIFSRLDTYGEHLQSVYEMPTFYGDETLHGLLEHSKEIRSFMKKYEGIYSFTQPDLEEQLLAVSAELENYDEEEATQEE